MSYILFHDDCLDRMAKLDESSMDSIVTDPPYGLSFMGKDWDHGVPGKAFWAEALRVAKPGAHLLAFGGTRTYHRLACAIEDSGWEIRDCVMWVYGSGFPKSHDVSKAIDKAAGIEREVIGRVAGMGKQNPEWNGTAQGRKENSFKPEYDATAAATDAAKQWAGWGTALKPAWEPIIVARKPLDGTVAENVIKHGTGAINVDGCRVGTEQTVTRISGDKGFGANFRDDGWVPPAESSASVNTGRWPANLIHDGSDEVVSLFPESNSARANGNPNNPKRGKNHTATSYGQGDDTETHDYRECGSAARFFYCAKASKADRDEGCKGLEERLPVGGANKWTEQDKRRGEGVTRAPSRNHHPTVKPTELMRYLCRLVTPPGGVVLDPFMGSGSTGKAALIEGFQFVGIEKNAEYIEIAKSRLYHAEHPGSVIAANDDEYQRELFDMEQYIREDAKR
ncbi:MAG: site-specific DNA-methyltransferase [Planctomycetes bacterium]|nr:site-specific DNA-methyltransferase [Planctomycetota bacterium]